MVIVSPLHVVGHFLGGTSGNDLLEAIAPGSDGSFALAGSTNSINISGFHGNFLSEGWVLKFKDQ